MNRYAIVMAAGRGSRMKSRRQDVSKVSFPILGKPMLSYVLDALKPLRFEETIVVVGHESTAALVQKSNKIVWQKSPSGTGDAAKAAANLLSKKEGATLVCCGDTPLLTSKTLSALFSSHEANHNDITVLTAVVEDPRGKGRILKKDGRLENIVEQKDCGPAEEIIHEINSGIYIIDNRELAERLERLGNETRDNERHLSDLVRSYIKEGKKVMTFAVTDPVEVESVNDRYELSLASKAIQKRINKNWMLSGVTLEDPDTTYIGPDAEIEKDTTIRPGSFVLGKTKIGPENTIGPNTYLENVEIGGGNIIEYCHLVDTKVEDGTTLGPYLRTRKGTIIRSGAHIGNFNELKNADFGPGSKAAHLSYLGDVKVGKKVNIGCGTIVANYDGVNKWQSIIESDVFVGSGSTLISPVEIKEGAFIAAGSTINHDVEAHAMAIARARQTQKEGYAKVLREKALEKKESKK